MKVIFRNKASGTPAAGRNLFATVARVSSNRLLDATLGRVTAWTDGEPIYVSSFGGCDWHWQADFPAATATDNETTCRPTSWIAGGLPGAAVRNLDSNRLAGFQNIWRIDSTALDNEGSGLVADPLKTDDELQRRLSGVPGLAQPTSVTWVQSPAGTTNLEFSILPGASVALLGVPISTPPAVISAVTLQNRATPQLWEITAPGLGAAHVGSTIEIADSATSGRIGAYACVLKDLGGGRVRVSPFGTKAVSTSASFVNVTPAIGDSVVVHVVPVLKIGRLAIFPKFQATAIAGSPLTNCATVDLLSFQGGPSGISNGGGVLFNGGLPFFFYRAWLDSVRLAGQVVGRGQYFFSGAGTKGGFSSLAGAQQLNAYSAGFISSLQFAAGALAILNQDCYFQASALGGGGNGSVILSSGSAFVDRASTTITVVPGSTFQQLGAVPDWGNTTAAVGVQVQSGAIYTYATKPTINAGLGVGRETIIGGVDTLLGAVPFVNAANLAAMVLTA